MFVLKYLFLGLFLMNVCCALNFKDIRAKSQKRKGFIPKRVLKPTNRFLPVRIKNHSNDKPPLNAEEPQIQILDSNDFPMTTTITAALVLRKALHMFPTNPCEIVKGVFQRIYDEYDWHCVDYNTVAVGNRKFINLQVKDRKYLLFATNK